MNKKSSQKSASLLILGIMIFSLFGGLIKISYSQSSYFEEKIDVVDPFGLCHAGYSLSDKEYDLLDALGNQWMRIDFSWTRIEPEEGIWDFEYMDKYVQKAQERGQKILAILNYGHPKLGHDSNFYIQSDQIQFFLEYVNKTVNRYKDNVSAFEIWNEPNHYGFWSGSEAEFFDLFNQTAEFIYEIDPNIRIIGPGMATHDPNYIERMFLAGITSRLFALSFHPYTMYADSLYQRIYTIRQLADKYGFEGEIWITEVGNPTGGTYGHSVKFEEQADRVIKTLVHCTVLDVRNIIWYCLFDSTPNVQESDPFNSEHYFGIVSNNYTWKPAAHAFSVFSNHTSHYSYYPNAILKQGLFNNMIRSFLYRNPNGETTVFIWADDSVGLYNTVQINVEINNNITSVLNHNIYTGSESMVSSNELTSFTLGNTAVVLTFRTSFDSLEPITISIMNLSKYIVIFFIPIIAVVILFKKKQSIA